MTVFSVVPDPKNPVAYTIRTQEGTYYDIAIAGRISKEALESCAAYLTSHRYNGLSKIHALIEKNETGEAIVLSMQARVDNAFSKAVFAQVRSFPSPQILDPKSKRQLAYDLISGNAGDLACSESLLKEISWEPEDDLLRLARLYSTPHLSPWGKALIRYAANEIGLNPTHVLSEGQENAPEATLAEEVMRLIDFSHFSSLISKHAAPYPGLVDALAKLWAETQDPRYLKHLCDTDSPALVREFLSKFPDHPSLFEGIDISEFYYLWNSTHYMEFAELFLAAGANCSPSFDTTNRCHLADCTRYLYLRKRGWSPDQEVVKALYERNRIHSEIRNQSGNICTDLCELKLLQFLEDLIDLTVPPLPIPRYEGICSLEPTTKIPLEKCTKEHAFAYQRLYHKLRNRSESSPDLLHLICNSTRIFNYLGDKRQVSDNFSSLIRDYHATFPESRFAKEIFDLLPYLKKEEAIEWLKEHPKQLLKTHSNALSKYMIGHEKAMIYYDLIEPFLGPESLVRIGSKSRFSELKDLYPYEAQEEICCKILSRLINWDLQAIKWLLQPLKVKWGSVALAERVNQLFYLSENFFHYSDEIRVQFILSYLKSIGYMDTQERFAFAVNGYMSGARFESIEQGLKTTRVLNRVLNEEQMLNWLAFFEMTRGQVGIPLCQNVLITQMASQKVVRAALSALERIGPYVHPMYANCVRLCTFSNNQGVEAQACKTLWALNPDPNCSWDRNILLEHLPHSISVLGNYNFDSNEDRRRIDQLIALSHSEDLNLRVECAQTLSRIPDKKALLRALEIAQSRDWALFDPYFKQYKQDLAGHHTLIMTRPQFEDSRTMMILRIQQQLLKIEPPPEGVFEQEESYEHLDRFEKRCKIKEECRFTPTPLFLPEGPGRYLFRGLCERKGDDLLPIAIRDLFMRGCGPSDLIGFGADYDQGTWSKTGQIFTSIDKSSVERHYVEDEGMLLVIRSSYYNRSYIRGRARMEKEGALNPVFYDGVPLSEIEAIYLPKSYQEDVELLASKELSDDEVYEELATTAFRHREFLPILRKNIRGLLPRIGYRDGGDAWYNPIKEREVIEESVRQRIARDWLVTQYPPGFFDPQDRKLSHLSDDEFLAHVDDLYPLFLNDEEIAFLRRTDLEEVKASLRNLDTSSISPSRLRRYKRLQVLFSPFGPEKAQEIIARCRPLYNIREGEEHMVLTPTP